MTKTWDQRRNAQVIEMRRNNARIAIKSLRHYREEGSLSHINMLIVKLQTKELIALYRQTNKVLHNDI
jgi:hypothetical protein